MMDLRWGSLELRAGKILTTNALCAAMTLCR
jgi:hypothetical protein